MELNNIISTNKKNKTRVGRGISAGQGKTAGRGTKGQKSRTGYKIPRRFEGGQISLIQRMPKKRGFTHLTDKPIIIDIALIEKHYKDGEVISATTLIKKGLIKEASKAGIKLLGSTKLTKKLTLNNVITSKTIAKYFPEPKEEKIIKEKPKKTSKEKIIKS